MDKTKSTTTQKNADFDVVVALDIGSTYCGYAWQWRTDFEKNMGNIQMNDSWGSGMVGVNKTKSCILLELTDHTKGDTESDNKADEKTKFKKMAAQYKINSFGRLAETRYWKLLKKERHSVHGTWLFFRRFKHLLCTDMFERQDNVEAEDHLSQHVPLVVVMCKFIEALKQHFLDMHKDTTLQLDRIRWVVTVPAIWSEKAKKLMRDAAEMSDIDEDHLLLALEPEAAVIHCMFLSKEQRGIMGNLGDPGQTLLVVDLGGLTCDMSAVKVLQDGKLKEMTRASGDIGGGQNINDAFIQTCQDSFVGNGWIKLSQTAQPHEMMAMEDDFESKKIQIGSDSQHDIEIELDVPRAMIDGLLKKDIQLKNDEKTNEHFVFDKEAGEFLFKTDYIKESLFKETVSAVWKLIDGQLRADCMRECEVVVLVGGFAGSPIIRQRIREEVMKKYPKIKVVSPTQPYLAVMKGAVLFGQNPNIFYSRISRETYGIKCNMPFDTNVHDLEKSFINEETREQQCEDVFSIHVTKGESVILHEGAVCQIYKPAYSNQKGMPIEIYKSTNVNPKYVTDEGCQKIGTIDVDMTDTTGGRGREVEVRMFYGGTELKVTAKNRTTGMEYKTNIRFREDTKKPEQ